MTSEIQNIYWRWKSDKPWWAARKKDLGDGLVMIYTNSFNERDGIIASMDEVEIKVREGMK